MQDGSWRFWLPAHGLVSCTLVVECPVCVVAVLCRGPGFLSKKFGAFRLKMAKISDERIKLVSQVLSGIKVIKYVAVTALAWDGVCLHWVGKWLHHTSTLLALYCARCTPSPRLLHWEPPYSRWINGVRAREMAVVRLTNTLKAFVEVRCVSNRLVALVYPTTPVPRAKPLASAVFLTRPLFPTPPNLLLALHSTSTHTNISLRPIPAPCPHTGTVLLLQPAYCRCRRDHLRANRG
jgi:hypothetical protein